MTGAPIVRPFRDGDREAVVALWRACGLTRPWNDPLRDIDRKTGLGDDGFLVLERDGVLIGSVMFGYDGHRGSVYYLGIHPDHAGRGHGRRLMGEVERRLEQRGCPKINLMVRADNAAVASFYEALGYEPQEVVTLGKRLIHDEPS